MILPGNCKPVTGSRTTGVALLEFFDCEKLPIRSRAVGTVTNTGSVGVIVCGFSRLKKKNALFLHNEGPPSPNFGMGIGPPMLKPQILCRYNGRFRPPLLLKKLLAFSASFLR